MNGLTLARILKKNGIKKTWLAERLGIDASAITHWTNADPKKRRPIPHNRINEVYVVLGEKAL